MYIYEDGDSNRELKEDKNKSYDKSDIIFNKLNE